MHWYHWLQIFAFAVVAAVAWKTPRAPLWVACLAGSYIFSVIYLKLAPVGGYWPPSQFIGLLLDGATLLLIREFHKEKWEYLGLGTIMAFMVTADLVQLFGVLTGFPPPFTRNNFGIILECLNYLALALIGGVGLMDWVPTHADDLDTVARSRVGILSRTSDYAHAETNKRQPLRKW